MTALSTLERTNFKVEKTAKEMLRRSECQGLMQSTWWSVTFSSSTRDTDKSSAVVVESSNTRSIRVRSVPAALKQAKGALTAGCRALGRLVRVGAHFGAVAGALVSAAGVSGASGRSALVLRLRR